MSVYKIQEGDTPITVARTYKTSITKLVKYNSLSMAMGGEMFALEFRYLGPSEGVTTDDETGFQVPSTKGLRCGAICKATFRATPDGKPIYESEGKYYVFPNGIPENQAIEVAKPADIPDKSSDVNAKIFVSEGNWFTVSPWFIGQELTIP